MNIHESTKRFFLLVVGDILSYIVSLILTLTFRYGELPGRHLLGLHTTSFSILFLVFILINFSAGLYDKQAAFIRGRIQGLLIRVQFVSAIFGVLFFYFAPTGIAPRANLFIFFIVSTLLILLWRTVMFPVFISSRRQSALILGEGEDIHELFSEINTNPRYELFFQKNIIPSEKKEQTLDDLRDVCAETGARIIVSDLHNKKIEPLVPYLYSLILSGYQIIDASKLYEAVFDRIPLSLVGDRWLIENSGTFSMNRRIYDTVKRVLEIIFSIIFGGISLIVYPFVYLAIKIEDGGPIFIHQQRVGKNGKLVDIVKFRSMSGNDNGKYGASGTTTNVVTKVGKFLRESRIDELPQFWNIIKGDISLIGPRLEFPALVSVYEKEIPYYNIRHMIKPGAMGWAQIYHDEHPHHSVATEQTRDKLSYDLFYLKNRSLTLDLKIILRTFQILLKRVGK
jgi:lipopolysaccharide/colanic/teichoic acid biosynthesis glycosyltransferase